MKVKYHKLALLLILVLSIVSTKTVKSAPFLELTPNNWKNQLQGKTVLVFMSLGCDIGSFASQMFGEALEDLKGVYISTFDVNSAYEMMQEKPFGLSTIALINNGVVLETSDETYKDFEYLSGYNNQQAWVYSALKRNGIKFTMPMPGEIRLEPKNNEGIVDLNKEINAIYRFEGNAEDESLQRDIFAINGKAKIMNGSFYSDGTYDGETGGEYAAGNYDSKPFQNGFTVHTNIKVIKTEAERKFVLSFGSRVINFELNKDKLLMSTELYGNLGEEKYTYSDDFFPLTEIPFNYDEWNSIIFSTDVQSRIMYLMVNGKRYKDIHLSKRFVKFFNQYGMGSNQGVCLHNFGWGGVLNGYADDIVVYERMMNATELNELYKKYSKGDAKK